LIHLVVLPVAALAALVPSLGYALCACPLFITGVLLAYERGVMIPGIRLEFLLETNFIIAGIITLAWAGLVPP
jgi:4-hydroxy-3-methylbut-2-enyl diphosphate reductase